MKNAKGNAINSVIPRPLGKKRLRTREVAVLELIAAGNNDKAIAEKLLISVYTEHKLVREVFRKLKVNSRLAAGMIWKEAQQETKSKPEKTGV